MNGGHRHMAIGELDLGSYHAASLSDGLSVLPALRMSAAFFTFLRANLTLGQPTTGHFFIQKPSYYTTALHSRAPPSSASSVSDSSSISDSDQVTLSLLTSPGDRLAALELIAESIRQQRKTAALALVRHPATILVLLCLLLLAWSLSRSTVQGITLCFSILAITALAIWVVSRRYLSLATERTGQDFLWGPYGSGSTDLVLGARIHGQDSDVLVGALVLRLQQPSMPTCSSRRRGSRTASMRSGGKGVIRAWTVDSSHRDRGIGADMLYEAIRLTKERCGRDAAVGFAMEHSNNTVVLPAMFNGPFRAIERRAAGALDAALAEWEASKKRRRC